MPLVSIIVPCYNEQATIRLLLEAIYQQTVPASQIEVIIADGLSTDRTRDVVQSFQQDHAELSVRLVDNPRRAIPSALNCALAAAAGRYIVRLDAHSAPSPDYVERCIEALKAGKAENVGGVWEILPGSSGWMAEAIAVAASHPFGVGDAMYRYTTRPGYVDTVPFGSFRREVFDTFGLFDESLHSNEDYEFNARLRRAGGRIWLDPRIRSVYFARPNLKGLVQQYWRYGYWKLKMLQRYPKTLRWRQALPPLFVLTLLLLVILSVPLAPARFLLAGLLVLYLVILAAGVFSAARRKKKPGLMLAVPVVIASMHISWGMGFLWSLISGSVRPSKS